MAVVRSNYKGPLGLPGGPVLNPGRITNVENWGRIRDHAVVKAWLKAGVIEVDGEEREEPGAPADGYAVVDKGRGWFVIAKGGEEMTKSLRKDDVTGFEEMSDEDKAAYVEANKPEA